MQSSHIQGDECPRRYRNTSGREHFHEEEQDLAKASTQATHHSYDGQLVYSVIVCARLSTNAFAVLGIMFGRHAVANALVVTYAADGRTIESSHIIALLRGHHTYVEQAD